MAFIPVADTIQINVKQQVLGVSFPENVYYLSNDGFGALTQAVADDIADAVVAAYSTSTLVGDLSTTWSLEEVVATDLTTASSPQFSGALGAFNGSDGGQLLPTQTCGLITWDTALRGRSFTGRTYLAGFTEGDSDGAPTAGVNSDIQAFAAAMITNFSSGAFNTCELGVVSRFSGTIPNPSPAGNRRRVPDPRVAGVFTPITQGRVGTFWATQRRRGQHP